jgi:hypothetical protein
MKNLIRTTGIALVIGLSACTSAFAVITSPNTTLSSSVNPGGTSIVATTLQIQNPIVHVPQVPPTPVQIHPVYVPPAPITPVQIRPVYIPPAPITPVQIHPVYIAPAPITPVQIHPVYVPPAPIAPVAPVQAGALAPSFGLSNGFHFTPSVGW